MPPKTGGFGETDASSLPKKRIARVNAKACSSRVSAYCTTLRRRRIPRYRATLEAALKHLDDKIAAALMNRLRHCLRIIALPLMAQNFTIDHVTVAGKDLKAMPKALRAAWASRASMADRTPITPPKWRWPVFRTGRIWS